MKIYCSDSKIQADKLYHRVMLQKDAGQVETVVLHERLRTHNVFTKDQCFTLIIISSP